MSEWWTYRPSDFLLFAPRTYYRLLELYNTDIWPLQVVALLAGAAILLMIRHRAVSGGRIIAFLLAAWWLWVAYAFQWQRYATINWAAEYFAVGFALEALLLIWIGVARDPLRFDSAPPVRSQAGLAIFVVALTLHPLLQLLFGRDWRQLEVFGVAPDPTAVATIGVLLAANRIHWIALPLPLIWCVIGGGTLWLINSA